mgnify:CR=1 FL=1
MNSSTRYISLVSVCKQPVKNFSNATFMLSFKTMQISMLSVTRSCRQNYYAIKINEKTGRFFMEQETACKASVYHT